MYIESLSELVVETVLHYDIDGYDWATVTYVNCGCGCAEDNGDFILESNLLDEEIMMCRKENECDGCFDFGCEGRKLTLSAVEIANELVETLAVEVYELVNITTRVCWE